jgi:hypothetical protein
MSIVIQSTIESVQTRKDKTLKITIGSQELNAEQMAELMSLNQSLAFTYISPKNITEAEKEAIDAVEVETPKQSKSQSTRLRNTLYKVWETTRTGIDAFNDFYNIETERIIEHYKAKISE